MTIQPEDTMKPQALRMCRLATGMTQAEFAKAIGISTQWLGYLERGDRPIEPRIAAAAEHIARPVHFWVNFGEVPGLSVADAERMMDAIAKASADDDAFESVAIVREPGGELMIGKRRRRDVGE